MVESSWLPEGSASETWVESSAGAVRVGPWR